MGCGVDNALIKGEKLVSYWYQLVDLCSKGERLLFSVSCTLGGELHSEGELHFRGSFSSFFMLVAGCVELCVFLEGPALHMLGCVEPCLVLEGSSMFWSQCVEPLPLSWGLTLLVLLSSSDPFWLSFAFGHLS